MVTANSGAAISVRFASAMTADDLYKYKDGRTGRTKIL